MVSGYHFKCTCLKHKWQQIPKTTKPANNPCIKIIFTSQLKADTNWCTPCHLSPRIHLASTEHKLYTFGLIWLYLYVDLPSSEDEDENENEDKDDIKIWNGMEWKLHLVSLVALLNKQLYKWRQKKLFYVYLFIWLLQKHSSLKVRIHKYNIYISKK